MRPYLLVAAGLLVTVVVAAGVAFAVLQLNPQQANLRAGVTIAEDSALVQAAARATPAVVSIVTQQQPQIARGSGYLATGDGYIVTSVDVIAGASGLTVLITGDSTPHTARLIDYDCQTGVAVIKIDKVSGLPTLAFADPTALVQGQPVIGLGGPLDGGAVSPGYVSAMHRSMTSPDPGGIGPSSGFVDTIQITAPVDSRTAGGPLLNLSGQVVGIAMQPAGGSAGGYALSVAGVQDDVQQILQSGQVVVASLGASTEVVDAAAAALTGVPEGGQVVTVTVNGPAATSGLQAGDIITQVDDVKVDAADPLDLLLRSRFHLNQRVTVTYWRNGSSTQVELTLGGSHPSCQ
ncbi:MAG: S1C family serine protease [Candidatus Dormibacterales bacterium]